LRRKESFSLKKNPIEVRRMYVDISEEIFEAMLDSLDGDYIIEAQVLASMKPTGW
jgi:hypothetical protein